MPAYLTYDLLQNKDITISGKNDWRYCTITFSADVSAAVAAFAYLYINDGDDESSSVAHSGSNEYEALSVTHVISADATQLEIALYGADPQETTEAYIKNVKVVLHEYNIDVSGGCPCCGSYIYV